MRGFSRAGVALIAALVVALPAHGQGKGNDKGDRGSDNRGRGTAEQRGRGNDQGKPAAAQARNDNRDQRGNAENRGSAARGNDQRGNSGKATDAQNRGNDANDFGQRRAAEVREVGGDVAGPARPNASRFRHSREFRDVHPAIRSYVVSDKLSERFAGRVVALALNRGIDDGVLVLRPVDNRVRVLNDDGIVLLDLSDDEARNLGHWPVRLRDNDAGENREGSPAFCRSGEGHPVWGRQWCLDKGFGLGADGDWRWGRADDIEDVVLRRRVESTDLTRDVLLSVLGDVVFNRLAAHAVTLGFADPLVGRWAVDSTGRGVLLVNSGSRPVAEIVDANGDDRADVLLIALKPW